MPNFVYKARNSSGKLINGFIDAENETSAAVNIEKLGLSPVDVSVSSSPSQGSRPSLTGGFKKVSHQELLVFTRQLSTLIATGAPLIPSLHSVVSQTNNIPFKQIIQDVLNSLESGLSFSESLAKHPNIFPSLYVSLVRVGETAGLLDKVLLRLAQLSTQEIDLRSRLRSALVYPSVLALVAFVIVNFILLGVLPQFVKIFEASQAKLPLPTRILLASSSFLKNFWWLLLLGIMLGLWWFRRYYRSTPGRYFVDSKLLRLPLFGSLTLKIIVTRFARSVAALIKSGVPVLEALTVVESTIPNVVLQGIIKDVRLAISQGQSLTEPFKASGLFPPMVIQLIDTGEHTGRLGEMFDQISDFYDPEIESTVRNLTSLLEPAMLLVMGSVVTFIALSVLLPIFNLISVIRR